MMFSIRMRPLAAAELEDSATWYETQRPGLGSTFGAEIQRVLDTLAADPKRFPIILDDMREAPVDLFPYAIYYRVKQGEVIVTSVFHTSRDPAIWKGRK